VYISSENKKEFTMLNNFKHKVVWNFR